MNTIVYDPQQHSVGHLFKDRKRRLVAEICTNFFTLLDVDVCIEPMPNRYHVVRWIRDKFYENYRAAIERLVDAGKTDDEILEEMLMQNAVTRGSYLSSIPEPLNEGEERQYADAKGVQTILAELDSTGKNLTHITRIQFCMDGRFCVTITPKNESDYVKEAAIDAAGIGAGCAHEVAYV